MDKKELKIGNLVNCWYLDNGQSIDYAENSKMMIDGNGKFVPMKIATIENHLAMGYYKDKYIGNCYSNLEPIPITDELLLKSGFNRGTYESLFIRLDEYSLVLTRSCFSSKEEGEWFTSIKSYDQQCTFMKSYYHQIQNLYFELTNGKELKLINEFD